MFESSVLLYQPYSFSSLMTVLLFVRVIGGADNSETIKRKRYSLSDEDQNLTVAL